MNLFKKLLFSIVPAIFFFSAVSVVHASTQLGGMDLNGWCSHNNQGEAVLVNNTTWDCSGNNQPIDFTSNPTPNCVWQYGISDAFAQQANIGNPYTWACFSNTTATPTPTVIPPTPTLALTPTPTGIIPPTPTDTPALTPTPTVIPPTPTLALTPTPTGTVTDLGGMTLDQYCSTTTGSGYSFLNTNNQWSCTSNGQVIDLNAACIWQYNITNAYAQEKTPGNVYSYDCFVAGVAITPTPTPTIIITPTPTPTIIITPTPTPVATDDWATYKYNAQRSSYNPNETIINALTASKLVQKLDITPPIGSKTFGPNTISDEPAVVNNVIYYGDWTGAFYARNVADGSIIWTRNLGVMTPPLVNHCAPLSVGVVSSPSVRNISIGGVQTPIVFIAGADGNMYALKASDGSILWKTQLATPSKGELLWDSPLEVNGNVYIGVASFGDCPLVQGRMYKLGWRFGDIQAVVKLVPDGCVGAGSWASPTYDQTNNRIYIATGTQDNACKVNGQAFVEPNALALVELDGTSLNILGAWRIPAAEQGPDSDFGVSPALATATINGVKTQVVEAANKNGHAYIFKRDAITAGPLEDLTLAPGGGGTCPDCSMGTISTAATDGTTYYQAMGMCNTTKTSNCAGTNLNSIIFAINPKDGSIIWQTPVAKQVISTPILLKDTLIVFVGNTVEILNRATGKPIIILDPVGTGSVLDGSGAVARGMLFFGDLNGNFYEYGL